MWQQQQYPTDYRVGNWNWSGNCSWGCELRFPLRFKTRSSSNMCCLYPLPMPSLPATPPAASLTPAPSLFWHASACVTPTPDSNFFTFAPSANCTPYRIPLFLSLASRRFAIKVNMVYIKFIVVAAAAAAPNLLPGLVLLPLGQTICICPNFHAPLTHVHQPLACHLNQSSFVPSLNCFELI